MLTLLFLVGESQRNPNKRKRKQKRVISPNLSRPISETEDIDIPDTTKQANIGEQDYPNACMYELPFVLTLYYLFFRMYIN